jgi:hypothetical protein
LPSLSNKKVLLFGNIAGTHNIMIRWWNLKIMDLNFLEIETLFCADWLIGAAPIFD